jgi:hypothetical protein
MMFISFFFAGSTRPVREANNDLSCLMPGVLVVFISAYLHTASTDLFTRLNCPVAIRDIVPWFTLVRCAINSCVSLRNIPLVKSSLWISSGVLGTSFILKLHNCIFFGIGQIGIAAQLPS